MSEMLQLLVNTGSHTCKLVLCTPAGEVRQKWRLEGTTLPTSPRQWLHALEAPVIATVHRLVHGGDVLTAAASWSSSLDEALRPFDALAPLHNPQARQWARACALRWPDAQHCLVPDTGFFAQLPDVSRTLPLPSPMRARYGLHRYGFHGLAHSALWQQLQRQAPEVARGRVVTLQLGGGCSAAAIRNGQPIDTSMSFTPLAGLVMATRPGDLDPGVLLHLLRSGLTVAEIEEMLTHESGLKGLSGGSDDMRELLASSNAGAQLAIAQFCQRVRHYIGAYAATLGGLDAVVFGGGIGEHAPVIRERICRGLDFLGVVLHGPTNASADGTAQISDSQSRVGVWVIRGDEEAEMLRLARPLLES
ncbi:MAG: acetate/propionate family kinase [Pseudomonadota bacterium]